MTLNIFFLTITIKKRELSIEEILHDQMVKKIQDENRDRQYTMYRTY
ncbi:YrzI family small protein [Cytobacillus dafuensis]|uniref:YrzI family small protein n=1 Tax=Cytobacillus dafuensis TaxID=1742359 RepID=A0A5B8Z6G7_CYTDA|nr:YrzI family small protein [Cytobacillus dafuensis]QED48722.1 YrzI family small protein [Cytobacillus dafuensis]